MKPAVRTVAVTKVFHPDGVSVEAVLDVTLDVAPGEFVALMGPSGCGKSTLLHLLGGLDLPTAGEVWVGDDRIDDLSESARAVLRRETVGFVFQAFNLVPHLTVGANIEIPGLLAKRPHGDVVAQRDDLLAALGLSEKVAAFPSELSGGQQQRVAIARALVNEPTVLLADEPTGNLDSRTGNEVLALLRQFHDRGQTIVLATHDAKVAAAADRVVFMRDGALVEQTELSAGEGAESVLARLVRLEA